MGNRQVKFQESVIRDFEETTPFNRAEVAHAFDIFSQLYVSYQTEHPGEMVGVHHIQHTIDGVSFANPDCELPMDYIADNFEKLQSNPFRKQICQTFCTSANGLMSFTEFVDMVSSFSPKADLEKKIFHAFQIFDFDHDGLINREDLYKMIDMMTHEESAEREEDQEKWQTTKEWIVDGVFKECHKGRDESDMFPNDEEPTPTQQRATSLRSEDQQALFKSKETLTIEDFRYCLYRSPDFKNTFSFNI